MAPTLDVLVLFIFLISKTTPQESSSVIVSDIGIVTLTLTTNDKRSKLLITNSLIIILFYFPLDGKTTLHPEGDGAGGLYLARVVEKHASACLRTVGFE